jgi:hypothetical protein
MMIMRRISALKAAGGGNTFGALEEINLDILSERENR